MEKIFLEFLKYTNDFVKWSWNIICEDMKVDIVLISYNQEKYIAQAVESVLMQRINNNVEVRVIVADDCSSDETLTIIKSYENQSPFPFIYLDSKENYGISRNYQRALAVCDGDYVAILEGDDWWCDIDRVQKHIDYLHSHKEVCYTKNAIYLFSQKNNSWCTQFDSNKTIITLHDLIFDNQLIGNLSSCVFNARKLGCLKNNVYDYSAEICGGCDWFIGLDLLQNGVGHVLHDLMSVYRIDTGENISRKKMSKVEEIAYIKQWYLYADMLLEHKYSNSFTQLYQIKTNEINKHYRYLLISHIEQYIPPIIVWVYKIFCRIYDSLKKIIKIFIPRKLYRLWKK